MVAALAQSKPILHKSILVAAALAILAGIVLRAEHLGAKSFWGDEILGLMHMLGYTEAEIVHAGPNIRTAGDLQAYFQLSGPRNDGPRPLVATIRSLASEDQLFTVTLEEALALLAQPKLRGRQAAKPPLRDLGVDPLTEKPEIGRASCRERV